MVKIIINYSSSDEAVIDFVLSKFGAKDSYEKMVVEDRIKNFRSEKERALELADELEERNAVSPPPTPIHHNCGDDECLRYILSNVKVISDHELDVIKGYVEKWKEEYEEADKKIGELDGEIEELKSKIVELEQASKE